MLYVGLDVHRRRTQVSVMDEEQTIRRNRSTNPSLRTVASQSLNPSASQCSAWESSNAEIYDTT